MFNHVKNSWLFLLVFLLGAAPVRSQRIVLDRAVKAGELTLFPDVDDETTFYYLPDKVHLASDANGRPIFSFLRYVENVRSQGGEPELREGTGGGILHALVELSVSEEQLLEASNELRKLNGEAKIRGPVIFSGGTVSVISSFAQADGRLSKQVVGVGRAPLIDGERMAVSMELTKEGAKILWESFKTPTPDLSFSFEMELEGYRAPKQALIEADFDKIYKHHAFQLGASGAYNQVVFGGEIELAFDDLVNNGAIKVTSMGSDEKMDELITIAYNKLTSMMFDPVNGTGNPMVAALQKKVAGGKSPIERANDLYKLNQGSGSSGKSAPAKSGKKSAWNAPWSPDSKPGWNLSTLPPLWAFNNAAHEDEQSKQLMASLLFYQDEWQPKHIRDLLFELLDQLEHVPVQEREKKKELLLKNKAPNITPLINQELKVTGKKRKYFNNLLLSDSERRQYAAFLTGEEEPSSELSALLFSRIEKLVRYQPFLNKVQKEWAAKHILVNINEPTSTWMFFLWAASYDSEYGDLTSNKKELMDFIAKLRELKEEDVKQKREQHSDAVGEALAEQKSDDAKKPALIDDSILKKLDETLQKEADEQSKKAAGKKSEPQDSLTAKKLKDAKLKGGVKDAKASDATNKADTKKKSESSGKKKAEAKKEKGKKDFKMAVMAAYQFKKVRQQGHFTINLNKYTLDKLQLRFDENIGAVDCSDCFRQVNLDDPLFKQREIVVMVDGFNADDFGKYINFVSLKLKKEHANGDLTYDEVRIDRDNFVKSANHFKVMYGWKGDNDRSAWLNYEYQVTWSFFGGAQYSTDWIPTNVNAISLAPPYLRKTIQLEADPVLLEDKQVRAITVKVYADVEGKLQEKQVVMMPSRKQYSSKVDLLLPRENSEYEYEINWRLFGNKQVSSGRKSTSEEILFVDEVLM